MGGSASNSGKAVMASGGWRLPAFTMRESPPRALRVLQLTYLVRVGLRSGRSAIPTTVDAGGGAGGGGGRGWRCGEVGGGRRDAAVLTDALTTPSPHLSCPPGWSHAWRLRLDAAATAQPPPRPAAALAAGVDARRSSADAQFSSVCTTVGRSFPPPSLTVPGLPPHLGAPPRSLPARAVGCKR